MSTQDALIAAIRAITVDLPDDQPNGPAERALLHLQDMLDPGYWPWGDVAACQRRLSQVNGAMAELCEALANETRDLRVAAEAHFGGDFRKPASAPKAP